MFTSIIKEIEIAYATTFNHGGLMSAFIVSLIIQIGFFFFIQWKFRNYWINGLLIVLLIVILSVPHFSLETGILYVLIAITIIYYMKTTIDRQKILVDNIYRENQSFYEEYTTLPSRNENLH